MARSNAKRHVERQGARRKTYTIEYYLGDEHCKHYFVLNRFAVVQLELIISGVAKGIIS